MTIKYLKNVLSYDIVNELVDIYNNADEYETHTMKKFSSGKAMHDVINVLKNVDALDTDRISIIHYYKHKHPYYPHTDYQNIEKDNIVLPLQIVNGPNPHLIVFDQIWANKGLTWTGDADITFKINKSTKGRPFDYDLDNKTDQPISESLYKRYLSWQPKEFWYGLSGTPYELKPGNMLQFDSKQLHATSVMNCEEKLGLTIRYKL